MSSQQTKPIKIKLHYTPRPEATGSRGVAEPPTDTGGDSSSDESSSDEKTTESPGSSSEEDGPERMTDDDRGVRIPRLEALRAAGARHVRQKNVRFLDPVANFRDPSPQSDGTGVGEDEYQDSMGGDGPYPLEGLELWAAAHASTLSSLVFGEEEDLDGEDAIMAENRSQYSSSPASASADGADLTGMNTFPFYPQSGPPQPTGKPIHGPMFLPSSPPATPEQGEKPSTWTAFDSSPPPMLTEAEEAADPGWRLQPQAVSAEAAAALATESRAGANHWVDEHDLMRFNTAHGAQGAVFKRALAEIRAGRKRTHWMWFVFPQLQGAGGVPADETSWTARFYAIRSLDEARAYLMHPILGWRLVLITEAMLGAPPELSAEKILDSDVDAAKLKSCMTLFAAFESDHAFLFKQVLRRFFGGEADEHTLKLLEGANA